MISVWSRKQVLFVQIETQGYGANSDEEMVLFARVIQQFGFGK